MLVGINWLFCPLTKCHVVNSGMSMAAVMWFGGEMRVVMYGTCCNENNTKQTTNKHKTISVCLNTVNKCFFAP